MFSARKFYSGRRGSSGGFDPATSPAMRLLPQQANTLEFIAGPFPASSSWVVSYGYVRVKGRDGAMVQFKSGATLFYQGVSRAQFTAFHNAPSKGKWIHANIIERDYDIL